MGKLSKIRKAIEKDPEAWLGYRIPGAVRSSRNGPDNWHPSSTWGPSRDSYRSFVRSVIKNLGVRIGKTDGGAAGKAGIAVSNSAVEAGFATGENAGSTPARITETQGASAAMTRSGFADFQSR